MQAILNTPELLQSLKKIDFTDFVWDSLENCKLVASIIAKATKL